MKVIFSHFQIKLLFYQVTATNNAYTSNSSEVANITFEEFGDVDDLTNVSMKRLNSSAVFLNWFHIKGVEGYKIQVRLPPQYPSREPVETKAHNITRKCSIILYAC